MKIAFVLGDFPSLSETFVLNQITGLIDRGHQVSIFAERRPVTSPMAPVTHPDVTHPDVTHPDVESYGLMDQARWEFLPENPLRRLLSVPTVWKWDEAHVRALNPFQDSALLQLSLRTLWATHLFEGARDFDVIQCHFGAHGVKAAHLRRMGALRGKLVTTFHSDDIVCYPKAFRGNVYAPLFQQGDLFLPVSEYGKQALLAQGCPAERTQVHRMGVDLRRFRNRIQTSVRPDSGARVRVVTVGRLVEKKGIADAIRAVAALPGGFLRETLNPAAVPSLDHVSYEFVVAGEGPLRSSLEKLAAELRVPVFFTGALPQDDVVDLLASADIFLAPSVTAGDGDIEGIPVSIMEAMASGLPVVSTWHAAIPELVTDGVSGFLADEHDVRSLTRYLMTLAENPELRARMGAAGRKNVVREFDIATLDTQLEQRYQQLLAPRAGQGQSVMQEMT